MDYLLQNWALIMICINFGWIAGYCTCALFVGGEKCDIIMMEKVLKENVKLRELIGENDLIE